MTPDGRHVVWSDGGNTAWVWSPKRPDESEALEPIDDYVSATAISADGRHVAIGTSTGTVELRRRGRTSGLPLPRPLRGEGQITACRLSARGDRLVTASVDGTVTLWDVTRRRPLHVLRPDARPDAHRGSSITALALAADGKRIAFSATSSDIEVWQESPQRHLKLDGHGGWVNDCALLPDGHVISASQDRTLKLWDLSSGACVDTIYGAAPFTSVSLAGGLICAGDALGNVWMLEPRERRDAPPIGPVRQRHAVLIGISTYDERELRALPNAVNDVHALGHALTSAGFNRVTSLHDGGRHPPTRERVRRALREQALQPDDLLLVHISCHGQRIGGEPYLLMRDSKFPFERQTTLAVAEIVELMESSRARRRVLLVDACGAGLAIGADDAVRVRTGAGSSVAPPPRVRSRGRVPIQRGVFSDDARSDHYVHVLGEGAVTLYSTTATQQAQEVGAYGAFTRSVIDVVSRAATSRTGRLTMTDLILHVTAAMRAGKDKAARQDPTVDARLLGDFIFLERRQKART
ncbi:MAG TPA: caspase family protein, partial [Kofleriaceae bacterium]|nr:caspase family protein [Kofleriaceae bacterium]